MRQDLLNFAELLKENGFNVYKTKSDTYFYFVKDNKIGYCQTDHFFGIDISTVHKPCKECGTGFGVIQRKDSPTVEDAEKAFYIPSDFSNYSNSVKKYSDWKEYQKLNTWTEYALF